MDLNKMTDKQVLEELKKAFEKENDEKMRHLNMFFKVNPYLSADLILEALMDKVEYDLNETEIDEHLIKPAQKAMEALNKLYLLWLDHYK